eukprot:757875-Hanusia_phi.AAC.1
MQDGEESVSEVQRSQRRSSGWVCDSDQKGDTGRSDDSSAQGREEWSTFCRSTSYIRKSVTAF